MSVSDGIELQKVYAFHGPDFKKMQKCFPEKQMKELCPQSVSQPQTHPSGRLTPLAGKMSLFIVIRRLLEMAALSLTLSLMKLTSQFLLDS